MSQENLCRRKFSVTNDKTEHVNAQNPPWGSIFFKWELNNLAYVQFKASHSKSLRWQQTPWVLLHAASISLSLSLSLSQQLSALLNLNHSLSTVYRKFSQAERERERERERESERLMPDDEMRRLWTSVVFQQHSTFDDYNGRSLSYIPRNAERRFRVYYIYFSQHNYIIKP